MTVIFRWSHTPQGSSDKRSNHPTPRLNIDTMAPVQSMLDGKMYDSKSALRATYKAAGVVEIGNDSSRFNPPVKPKPDRKKIRESIKRAKSRLGYGS